MVSILDVLHQQKFHIVPRCVNSPGVCAFTGKHDDDWFIDTGLFLDYYGTVYMSKSYFVNILRILTAGNMLEDFSPVGTGEAPKIPEIVTSKLDKIEGHFDAISGDLTQLFNYLRGTGLMDPLKPETSLIVERDETPRSGAVPAVAGSDGGKEGPTKPSRRTQLERVPDSDINATGELDI